MSTLADKAASPRVAPNLFLTGYADDAILARDELAAVWQVTPRTVLNLQHGKDGLPYLMNGGRVFFRAGSAREWMRSREQHRNQQHRRGGRK